MSEYQKIFLFYVFIYYLFKGGICIACFMALNRMMKKALERKKQYTFQYMKRISEEEERWHGVYKSEDPAVPEALDLSQLVTNPKSFTAYSNVSKGPFHLGYRHRMFANG